MTAPAPRSGGDYRPEFAHLGEVLEAIETCLLAALNQLDSPGDASPAQLIARSAGMVFALMSELEDRRSPEGITP